MASHHQSRHSHHNIRSNSIDTDLVSPLQCSRDMEKIQRLWDQTKQISNRLQADRSNKRKIEQSKHITRVAQNECYELRSSLKYVESNLQRTRQNYDILKTKFQKVQSELDRCYQQIARQASTNRQQGEQIKEMSSRINQLTQMHHDYIMKNKVKVSNYQREIDLRDQEIERMKAKLECQHQQLGAVTKGEDQMRFKLQEIEEELLKYKDENDSLKIQLKKNERQLNDIYISRRSQGSFEFEIQQLRADNRKLLQMLKSTRQYREFGQFAEDSGGEVRSLSTSKGMRKIAPSPNQKFTRQPFQPSSQQGFLTPFNQSCQDDSLMDEWIPSQAYEIAKKFSKDKNFSQQIVSSFVTQMNQIWRDREKRQLNRIKTKYGSEISTMKRQLSQRVPFDQLTAQKQISRLKSQLRNAQGQAQKSMQIIDKNKQQPPGIQFLDTTIKLTTAMQKQRRQLQGENIDLKKRVSVLEKLADSEQMSKFKFMEGASWFADKAIKEAENHQSRANQLVDEFEQQINDKGIEQNDPKGQSIYQSAAFLREALIEATGFMVQNIEQKKESAEFHVKSSEKKLDDILTP